MIFKRIDILFALILTMAAFGLGHADVNGNSVASSDSFPINKGKLVFHSYTDYSSGDGKLFIYDFGADTLVEISKNWNIHHTINGHFSPDGKELVFMAQPAGQSSYNSWNIYLWSVGSENEPERLTPNNNIPNEDPKFFPDGQRIVFKQNGDIKILNLSTKQITAVTSDGFDVEESMPYPTTDGEKIVYTKNSKIYIIDIDGTNDRALTTENHLGCYYPIVKDDTSYFYPRWYSTINHHDDVYLGNLLDGTSVRCPFNKINDDDSDPFPVSNTDYVFFSSNRSGGQGDWDIYLGNAKTGQVWLLNKFGINSAKMELGSAYYCNNTTVIYNRQPDRSMGFILRQNYPNPFNPSTIIIYRLPESGEVELSVYTLLGEKIRTLVNTYQRAGKYTIRFYAAGLSAGVYFYKLTTGKNTWMRKMLLMR